MTEIVVIGKNSFLAQKFRERFPSDDTLYLSHHEALNQHHDLENARAVVNFSFAPQLSTQAYQADLDSDSKHARMIGENTHYIMLSSRMVYGDSTDKPEFSEKNTPNPVSVYGRNKLAVEQSLQKIVPADRLTILRLSNIFGFEPERKTFFGTALTNLLVKNRMTFDIAPESVRDFLPVEVFSGQLETILKAPKGGLFNIGSNIPVSCFDITRWLIEGYGEGEAVFESSERRGEFFLNTAKAKKNFALEDVSVDEIRLACIACGQKLKSYRASATA